ncbi:MAG: divalent cation transporter [Rhizobiales bacterium 24-66-13]|jgi:H+-transporting ATPase|nr:MAG: divalent cation transporter [Rhizobiales bacterium 24-66-13]OZB12232.1 MAG: divalent cation transporter [Rhizobiales bacterium 39-66-18]HQS44926.1 HAD-IC family P-type ATPase [Xanthobacteraceae bacterium]
MSHPQGLTETEAKAQLARYGYNEIRERPSSGLRSILKRLWGPIPWMLEAALILEIVLGKTVEPAIIAGWLTFSAILGGVQERRAQSALDLLRSRLRVSARVFRDGSWRIIPARELAPGDRISVTTGDLVPADCTMDEGIVDVDQAALTGESVPASRGVGETIYSGSTVQHGQATGTVTATGRQSYFGRTAELVRTANPAGHLEQLLFAVVRHLVTVDAVLAVVLAVFALWHGEDLLPLVPFFLVLVTATVPVTMPAAFTVANAVEARKLADEGVLVTGLPAVQEAATMDVLCIDKTGTLTENRHAVAAIIALPGESETDILAWAATACDGATQGPVDLAILGAARQRSIPLLARKSFTAFDPAAKRSEALLRANGDEAPVRVILGSPQVVASLAEPQTEFQSRVEELAASGARVLAVATGVDGHLHIRGLVALADTVRGDAGALVKAIKDLGIKVVMVTGDTSATARAVGAKVGLGDRFGDADRGLEKALQFDGFANVYPEEKFQLVKALQQSGRIVGMTGDGVNDAPALKQAEVGIAVQAASDVAKAAAQIVLTRPGLEGIVSIISGGRRVYRRMLTWTITKVARTVELAALLTIGYILTGFFLTPLVLIAIIIVLNDVVTITLATDRAWVSSMPEKWNVGEIARLGGALAIGWLILAFGILWVAMAPLKLPVAQIQTLMFVYLMYSAQATIYLARTPDRFWSFAPSRYVAAATIGNVVIATILGTFGLLMAAVPVALLIGMLVVVLLGAILLDQVKIALFRNRRSSVGKAPS